MSYRVRTDSFEGPFDLLLYLVGRQRVDIGSISVSEIVDQYLTEVSKMEIPDLDVASDFLLVASTLLEIKAHSLIPQQTDETTEELQDLAPNEARELLIEKLIAYKQYKNAAGMLSARAQAQAMMHPRTFGPPEHLTRAMPDFLRDVSLDSLAYLAASAFGRQDIALLESEHIAAKPIPVELHVRALHARLVAQKRLRFSDIVNDDTPTPVVVVTFLALLELYKRQMITLEQDALFGDIEAEYIEGSGELVFADDDEYADASEQKPTQNARVSDAPKEEQR